MSRFPSLVLTLLVMCLGCLGGCEHLSPFISDALWSSRLDVDHDGIPRPDDCDDRDPSVGIRIWYRDVDQDGHGAGTQIIQCELPLGATNTNDDCDDTRKESYPGATELCDGLDNNCNGQTDEGVIPRWFADTDHDGYGNALAFADACQNPQDHVSNADDCDDTHASVHPTQPELCDGLDNNCNGQTDEGVIPRWYEDADKDTYGNPLVHKDVCVAPNQWVLNHTDCDDTNPKVHPGMTETCNNIDDDCNNQTDEGVLLVWYQDADHDGHGNKLVSVSSCQAPQDFVASSDDCDDTNKKVYAFADELCDKLDNNCNGQTDEGVQLVWFKDEDQDGFGNPKTSMLACTKPIGFVANNTDCDDTHQSAHPGASEICGTGVDEDCNGQTDEIPPTTWYIDVDQDGFGDPNNPIKACTQPLGTTLDHSDCDDTKKSIHPDATEVCNYSDDNCNGQTDEGVTLPWHKDQDQDGFGDPNDSVQACAAPKGYVSDHTDCNDTDSSTYPQAPEICDNNTDENCDGVTDNAPNAVLWYQDADQDGYGNKAITKLACAKPNGFVSDKTDCDDMNPLVHPNATELCGDNIDNDCNGKTDTDAPLTIWYKDADQDGYGDKTLTTQTCSQPIGFVENAADCDDTDPNIHPGAQEICNNGVDDNCDGSVNQCVLSGTNSAKGAITKIYGNADKLAIDTMVFSDVNGDGFDDLLVGAKNDSGAAPLAGAVYLFFGPIPTGTFLLDQASAKWTGENQGDQAGFSLSSGDVNGDGKDDILIGAPTHGQKGCVYLLLGSANLKSGSLSQANAKWIGENQDNQAGSSLSTGDANGDGKDDILIGAPGDPQGIVYLIFGSANPKSGSLSQANAKWDGVLAKDQAGMVVNLEGDVNGDGKKDILITAQETNDASNGPGSIYLIFGSANPTSGSLSQANTKWVGEVNSDKAGYALATGDLNGDGKDDILISAPGNTTKKIGVNTGAVYLIYGSTTFTSGTLAQANTKWIGESEYDNAGLCISVGNADQNNKPDLLITSYGNIQQGSNHGAGYLIYNSLIPQSGGLSQASAKWTGETKYDMLGKACSLHGDVNADGYKDITLIAPLFDNTQTNEGVIYIFHSLGL